MSAEANTITRSILIPVDNIKHCKSVLKWYAKKVRRRGDLLYMLHMVTAPPALPNDASPSKVSLRVQEACATALEVCELSEKFRKMAKIMKVQSKPLLYYGTRSGVRICKFAKRLKVDLVLLGVKSPESSSFGALSSSVVTTSTTPVLVVPNYGELHAKNKEKLVIREAKY